MSDERPSDVLGALPRRRPHRRSDKRPAPVPAERAGSSPPRGEDAAGERTPNARRAPTTRARGSRPARKAPTTATTAAPIGRDILGIAAQVAAELAEIGLSVGARALRNAVSRLPRP